MEPKIGEIEPDVIWLHFDAKYRVNKVDEIFGPDIIEIEKNERRSDNNILKIQIYSSCMHIRMQ